MAKRQQTQGVCQLCQSMFIKSGMTRHLTKCLADHEAEPAASKRPAKTVRLLRLVVEGKYNPEYWLQVEMPATATLRDLDDFLRNIWLECCGHLSAFEIGGIQYSVETAKKAGGSWFMYDREERSMDVAIGKVLSADMKFTYEYDFGSTTHLALRVVGERAGHASKERVRLLARNEPPQILCEECKVNPAAWVDVFENQGWLCEKCNENAEEGVLPVVNSPRVGVCAYTGD